MKKTRLFLIMAAMSIIVMATISVFSGCNRKICTHIQNENKNLIDNQGKQLAKKWTEKEGIIHLFVTSNGMTGEQWVNRLTSQGVDIDEDDFKSFLLSKDFKPTNGVTYKIAILRSELFYNDENRTTINIREEANKHKFSTPNIEVACLIRDKFSNKELEDMELWSIVVMHEPIKDSQGDPLLLNVSRAGNSCLLYSIYGKLDRLWLRSGIGFAFVAGKACCL